MDEQQKQAFVAAIRNVGEQMTRFTIVIGAQGVARTIKPFNGNGREF